VFNALKVGAIPVYYGAPNVRHYLPSSSAVILAVDFASGKDLAQYILQVRGLVEPPCASLSLSRGIPSSSVLVPSHSRSSLFKVLSR
jgi:hypothetical protein